LSTTPTMAAVTRRQGGDEGVLVAQGFHGKIARSPPQSERLQGSGPNGRRRQVPAVRERRRFQPRPQHTEEKVQM
jgi:hypothetical protein